jgi:hypothetical protein
MLMESFSPGSELENSQGQTRSLGQRSRDVRLSSETRPHSGHVRWADSVLQKTTAMLSQLVLQPESGPLVTDANCEMIELAVPAPVRWLSELFREGGMF